MANIIVGKLPKALKILKFFGIRGISGPYPDEKIWAKLYTHKTVKEQIDKIAIKLTYFNLSIVFKNIKGLITTAAQKTINSNEVYHLFRLGSSLFKEF